MHKETSPEVGHQTAGAVQLPRTKHEIFEVIKNNNTPHPYTQQKAVQMLLDEGVDLYQPVFTRTVKAFSIIYGQNGKMYLKSDDNRSYTDMDDRDTDKSARLQPGVHVVLNGEGYTEYGPVRVAIRPIDILTAGGGIYKARGHTEAGVFYVSVPEGSLIPVSVNTTSDTVSETVLKIGALYPAFKKHIEEQHGLKNDEYISIGYAGYENIRVNHNNPGGFVENITAIEQERDSHGEKFTFTQIPDKQINSFGLLVAAYLLCTTRRCKTFVIECRSGKIVKRSTEDIYRLMQHASSKT